MTCFLHSFLGIDVNGEAAASPLLYHGKLTGISLTAGIYHHVSVMSSSQESATVIVNVG